MAKRPKFNPFATKGKGDYDDETAKKRGMQVKKGQHGGSLDPKTGMVLKSRGHPSFFKTRATEEHLDSDIKFKKGRYYSVPRKKRMADTLKPKKGR